MRVGIFNVKYSPNLGDGLLSECLERELQAARADITACSIDLAGRTDYGAGSTMRGRILSLLEASPRSLRGLFARVVLSLLVAVRLRPFFRAAIKQCDAVVVGGGNLFADTDLNFPYKINAAVTEASALGLPVAVFGVGLTRNWSPTGARLFGEALAGARMIDATVRDERSRDIWTDLLGPFGIVNAGLARDPGLLAARHYEAGARSADGHQIGVCITDPLALRYHGGRDSLGDDIEIWYGAVSAALADAGYRVALFTNGSPEDRAYLAAHSTAWTAQRGGAITTVPGFANPAGLVRFISSCDLIVAHRMHACIAAHAFGIPTIGLAWDVKLNSFFGVAGRNDFMADPARLSPADLAALATRAMATGVDKAALDALIASSRAEVARLADVLAEATAPRG